MDFGRFLFLSGKISFEEYLELVDSQVRHGFADLSEGFLSEADRPKMYDDWAPIGVVPAGEALLHMPEVAERLLGTGSVESKRARLMLLVRKWQEWCRNNIEPICFYSTSTRFGRKMYEARTEKKLVASFLTTAKVRDGMPIVHTNDVLVIPEGSSGTYVGLAVAAHSDGNVRIVTSNAGLIREYQDNPALVRCFREFRTVGGVVDNDHGAVDGPLAEKQFVEAIANEPGATIVIMTVSRLTADNGPHVSGPTVQLRHAILTASLNHRVREVVFVADHSKVANFGDRNDGAPVFGRDEWKAIVEKHRPRICIVTAPPPGLRSVLALGLGNDVVGRDLQVIEKEREFVEHGLKLEEEDRTYDLAAKALRKIAGVPLLHGVAHSMFHEAYQFPTPIPTVEVRKAAVGTRAGEICGTSGVHRLNCQCGHQMEVPVTKGHAFPKCPSCHGAATWTLVKAT